MKRAFVLCAVILLAAVLLCGCVKDKPSFPTDDPVIVLPGGDPKNAVIPAYLKTPFKFSDVGGFSGLPCAEVNGGRR